MNYQNQAQYKCIAVCGENNSYVDQYNHPKVLHIYSNVFYEVLHYVTEFVVLVFCQTTKALCYVIYWNVELWISLY